MNKLPYNQTSAITLSVIKGYPHAQGLISLVPVVSLAVIAGATLSGCATLNHAYTGPTRAASEVAVIVPGMDRGFQSKSIHVKSIDGQDKIGDWTADSWGSIRVVPGEHTLLMGKGQTTMPTFIPIVDMFTLAQDLSVTGETPVTTLTFPAKAGVVHRIHYDATSNDYWVSRKAPIVEPVEPADLTPPADATLCITAPDRTKEFWCALGHQSQTKPAGA